MNATTPDAHDSATHRAGPCRPWMRWALIAAGCYNLAWGAWVILAPRALFDLLGVAPQDVPNATGLAVWQCLGMVIGVYGIGYFCAAIDPLRHWPIVLVGLLGKVFGPIGFVDAALIKGNFPPQFGWTILTNDLVWWYPFGAILLTAWRTRRERAA